MKTPALVLSVLGILPLFAQASVDYGNSWNSGKGQTYQQQLQAPAGTYRLDISTTSQAPVSVYSGFLGKNAAPIVRLNQAGVGQSSSVEVELKATKPGLAFGYLPLSVKIGNGKALEAGSYQMTITPLF